LKLWLHGCSYEMEEIQSDWWGSRDEPVAPADIQPARAPMAAPPDALEVFHALRILFSPYAMVVVVTARATYYCPPRPSLPGSHHDDATRAR